MKAPVIVTLVCLLLPVVEASAQIYRCKDPDGVPRFQGHPCPDGNAVELRQPAARWEALRPAERRLWEERRRAEKVPRSGRGAPAETRASERVCWQKRRRLEAVSARLRRGYRAGQGERLRRRRDTLQGFIRRYCE